MHRHSLAAFHVLSSLCVFSTSPEAKEEVCGNFIDQGWMSDGVGNGNVTSQPESLPSVEKKAPSSVYDRLYPAPQWPDPDGSSPVDLLLSRKFSDAHKHCDAPSSLLDKLHHRGPILSQSAVDSVVHRLTTERTSFNRPDDADVDSDSAQQVHLSQYNDVLAAVARARHAKEDAARAEEESKPLNQPSGKKVKNNAHMYVASTSWKQQVAEHRERQREQNEKKKVAEIEALHREGSDILRRSIVTGPAVKQEGFYARQDRHTRSHSATISRKRSNLEESSALEELLCVGPVDDWMRCALLNTRNINFDQPTVRWRNGYYVPTTTGIRRRRQQPPTAAEIDEHAAVGSNEKHREPTLERVMDCIARL